jgi:hypothetical protein
VAKYYTQKRSRDFWGVLMHEMKYQILLEYCARNTLAIQGEVWL